MAGEYHCARSHPLTAAGNVAADRWAVATFQSRPPCIPREPPHHLHRPTLVHREAYQLAGRIDHLPEPAALLALDRVAELRGGGGSLGLALLGIRGPIL